jgi:hypothetical protein
MIEIKVPSREEAPIRQGGRTLGQQLADVGDRLEGTADAVGP